MRSLQEDTALAIKKLIVALCLLGLFIIGCKLPANDNNSNNQNSDNSNSTENGNDDEDDSNSNNSNKSGNSNNSNSSTSNTNSSNPFPTPATGPATTTEKKPGDDRTIRHTGSGVQFTIPNGWVGEERGDRYVAKSPDEKLQVFFYVPADGNFKQAVHDISAELNKMLSDLKADEKEEKGTLNGMDVVTQSGQAKHDGIPVAWALTAMNAPAKPFFIVSVADPQYYSGNEAGYKALLASVKKLQ
jgi:hypothetical protein